MVSPSTHNSAEEGSKQGSSGGLSNACQPVRLSSALQEHSYIILDNDATGRNRMHMDSLGLIPNETVHVLFKNFSGFVVAIKGSRLALGKPLAACLTVQEVSDPDWQPDDKA